MNKLEYQQVEQVGIRNQLVEMSAMLRFQQVEQVGTPMSCAQFV